MSKSKQIIKEGDVVVCINPADNIYIEQGREYEVLRVCENNVVLNTSIGNVRYPACLFELKANTEVFKAKEFHPEPGDTIVCNNGAEYVCVTAQEYKKEYGTDGEHAIYAFAELGSHMRWPEHNGKSLYNSDYDIAEVIKQANTEVFKANKADKSGDNNLEYQVKVLEKENAMLRSLLRKHGAFI